MNGYLIKPGDIFATKGRGFTGWVAEHLTKTPSGTHTDRFHFGIIGDPVFENGKFIDYETRESLSKGVSCARFFKQYFGKDVELYKVVGIRGKREQMVRATSEIGTCGYGYWDFVCLVWDALNLILRGKLPPYTSQQLKYSANDVYICTEVPGFAMRKIGCPLEPEDSPRIWDIPTVYKQAEEEMRLIRYFKGTLPSLREILNHSDCNGDNKSNDATCT